MGRRIRIVKPGLQQVFEDHASAVYSGMRNRLAERRNENNKIIRVGRQLPFTVAEFRVFIKKQFNGNVDSIIRCPYCSTPLNVSSYECDHDMPIARGGGIGFDNLRLICEICNREKGRLSGAAFKAFREWAIANLHPAEVADIFGRLKNGGGYLKVKWKAAAAAAAAKRKASSPTLIFR